MHKVEGQHFIKKLKYDINNQTMITVCDRKMLYLPLVAWWPHRGHVTQGSLGGRGLEFGPNPSFGRRLGRAEIRLVIANNPPNVPPETNKQYSH